MLLAALLPKTVSTPFVNITVVATLARWLAVMTTPAPITVPTSSRHASHLRPLLLRPFISVLLSRAGPRSVGFWMSFFVWSPEPATGGTVRNRRGTHVDFSIRSGKRNRFAEPSSSFVNGPVDAVNRCSAAATCDTRARCLPEQTCPRTCPRRDSASAPWPMSAHPHLEARRIIPYGSRLRPRLHVLALPGGAASRTMTITTIARRGGHDERATIDQKGSAGSCHPRSRGDPWRLRSRLGRQQPDGHLCVLVESHRGAAHSLTSVGAERPRLNGTRRDRRVRSAPKGRQVRKASRGLPVPPDLRGSLENLALWDQQAPQASA